MKYNRNHLISRIITSPFKLALHLVFGFITAFLITWKWIRNGSQELIYGSVEDKESIAFLINQNKEIIKKLNEQKP